MKRKPVEGPAQLSGAQRSSVPYCAEFFGFRAMSFELSRFPVETALKVLTLPV